MARAALLWVTMMTVLSRMASMFFSSSASVCSSTGRPSFPGCSTAGSVTTGSVTSGASLVFGGITVPAGGNVMLVYETEVTAEADGTAGAEIVNTVTAEGTGFDPVTASAAVPVAEGPVLALTKALTPQTVSENGTLTYTFTLTNTGNAEADAATGVVLADTFDPVLTGVTVTLGGAVWPDTNYVYDPVTGSFTTNSGAITVPAATFARAPDGTMTSDPGVTVITVTGTV